MADKNDPGNSQTPAFVRESGAYHPPQHLSRQSTATISSDQGTQSDISAPTVPTDAGDNFKRPWQSRTAGTSAPTDGVARNLTDSAAPALVSRQQGPSKKRQVYPERHPRREFYPGLIVSLIYHKHDTNPPAVNEEEDVTQTLTKQNSWVHSKKRFMIVIERYRHHYVAIPIFTHEGKGVGGKANKAEFIGVRDSEQKDPPESEGGEANILAKRRTEFAECNTPGDPHCLHEKSHAHFTCPVSIEYKVECIPEMYIRSADDLTRLLRAHYTRSIYNPNRPPDTEFHDETDARSTRRAPNSTWGGATRRVGGKTMADSTRGAPSVRPPPTLMQSPPPHQQPSGMPPTLSVRPPPAGRPARSSQGQQDTKRAPTERQFRWN